MHATLGIKQIEMKKILLLFALIIALAKPASAQIDWTQYSQSYHNGVTDKPANIGIIACEKEINNAFWDDASHTSFTASFTGDTAFMKTRSQNLVAITTFDTAKVYFILHGINSKNAADFEYRVMTGKAKTPAPWTGITKFIPATLKSPFPGMAYIGGFVAGAGASVIADVRSKVTGKIVATAVVFRKPIQPAVTQVYLPDELNFFLKHLARPWAKQTPEEMDKWRRSSRSAQLDPLTGLPKRLSVEANDNNLIFILNADIYNKNQLEYKLVKNGDISEKWKVNDFDNGFIWLKNLKPGGYVLRMRYTAQREHVTAYPFEVKTPWYQSDWFHIIGGILICAFGGLILSLLVHFAKKKEAERELAKKTKLQLELKSIYAQLNPHFIFNALSSIQGLINIQDIKGANSYLADFARLMRESLNNGEKDHTSLDKEVAALDTYLKLEQLRFGFSYQINTDKNINAFDTEIPALLLQPLVENAVKHGVSALQDKGLISINFTRVQNNMLVNITDNGNGFMGDSGKSGFGLKLTRDRIKLLNEFNREQPVTFEIKSNTPSGTNVELIFNNWFL